VRTQPLDDLSLYHLRRHLTLSAAQTATPDNDNALVCGPEDGAYTSVLDIIACFNYLRNLGETPCEFDNREVRTLCSHGSNGVVVGIGTTGQHESSYWYAHLQLSTLNGQ
jgi:hypothetical protein